MSSGFANLLQQEVFRLSDEKSKGGITMGRCLVTVFFAVMVFSLSLAPTATGAGGDAFTGRKLFVTHCFLCHGVEGKGDGPLASKLMIPPTDLTARSIIAEKNDAQLVAIIDGTQHHAPAATSMPKWGRVLSVYQVRKLVAYLRFLSESPNPLIGNPDAGAEIYERYCTACHGITGSGHGMMTNLLPIKPIDHTNAQKMDKISNEKLIETITDGKGTMPAWEDILTESEIKDLVSYIRLLSGFWVTKDPLLE